MRLDDFRALVDRLAGEVPPHFLEGVAEVTVSPRTVPHPTHAEIYTLGECIPLAGGPLADARQIQSRIVLYHGSFQSLAHRQDGFEWRTEVWETLTHELRHHLEWKASVPDLEKFDEAAEHNFARQEGAPFDPLFYLDGERVVKGVYRIDDDYFLDRVVRALPARIDFVWHGRRYRAEPAKDLGLPCFLTVDGVREPPPGELLIVLRRRARLRDLFQAAPVSCAKVVAEQG